MNNHRNNNSEDYWNQPVNGAEASSQSEIEALVRQAAGGDFEAFSGLYHKFVVKIYRYVFYKVRDKMTAEDITQRVFLKALKSIGTCRGREATFPSWLYRIAYNQTVDVFRQNKTNLTIKIEISDEVPDPKQDMDTELRRQELLEVIGELSPSQKEVIILKFIDGLDNSEIGQIMGKSQGAIRILQMRALSALREKLETNR